jgi:hypothetical protein
VVVVVGLPPLADLDALAARLGRPLSEAQRVRAAAVLADVSDEVRAETGRSWLAADGNLDPARPAVLAVVTLRAARRAIDNPSNLGAETIGDYTRRFPAPPGPAGVYLDDAERRMLRAATGTGDLVSVPTVRDVAVYDRVWVSDGAGGDLILYDQEEDRR